MPSLSIITVNLNNAQGLALTIRSVLSQTFRDFEFIVIDGDSTDESISVLKQFQSSITKWISEKDTGIYHAQNKGIGLAGGDYCLFLNSGDYLAESRVVEKMFYKNNHADIFYGDLLLKKGDAFPELRKSPDTINRLHLLKDTLWHPVSFIRRKLFHDYGMYEEKYKIAGDYEFFVRTLIKYKIKAQHIPVAVSVFDVTGMSSNPLFRKQLERERSTIQDLYFNPLLLFFFRMYSKLRN